MQRRNDEKRDMLETIDREMVLLTQDLEEARKVERLDRVQRLGFGTWAWGNKLLWGYDTDDDPQLQAAFDAAVRQQNPFDNSRIFFDTGDSYGTGKLEGQAEALLGRFRAESRGPDRAVIGTKLAVYPTRLTAQSFEDACRASLARMERDQIELVQAHWSAKNFQPW